MKCRESTTAIALNDYRIFLLIVFMTVYPVQMLASAGPAPVQKQPEQPNPRCLRQKTATKPINSSMTVLNGAACFFVFQQRYIIVLATQSVYLVNVWDIIINLYSWGCCSRNMLNNEFLESLNDCLKGLSVCNPNRKRIWPSNISRRDSLTQLYNEMLYLSPQINCKDFQ